MTKKKASPSPDPKQADEESVQPGGVDPKDLKEVEGPSAEPVPEDAPPLAAGKTGAKTSVGYVEATLRVRHCSGGRCKNAGETMRMTKSEYERLKKHGRVE